MVFKTVDDQGRCRYSFRWDLMAVSGHCASTFLQAPGGRGGGVGWGEVNASLAVAVCVLGYKDNSQIGDRVAGRRSEGRTGREYMLAVGAVMGANSIYLLGANDTFTTSSFYTC